MSRKKEYPKRADSVRQFQCAGKWDSFINDTPESGQIEVLLDAAGNISGTHLGMNEPINGKCEHTPTHHIHFTVIDGDCEYTYDGNIGFIPIGPEPLPLFVIAGTRHRKCTGTAALTDGDDDWVGTKTT